LASYRMAKDPHARVPGEYGRFTLLEYASELGRRDAHGGSVEK
jgi:hypothetical protein